MESFLVQKVRRRMTTPGRRSRRSPGRQHLETLDGVSINLVVQAVDNMSCLSAYKRGQYTYPFKFPLVSPHALKDSRHRALHFALSHAVCEFPE